jgi:uroporphyrinogen decarboxylase
MTDSQWLRLIETLDGRISSPPPAGFIIDSPWLPRWAGPAILDYYAGDELWLAANLLAQAEFPEFLFLPGFRAEYGMCTEPSAFGAPCNFPPGTFPFARPVLRSVEDIDGLKPPDSKARGAGFSSPAAMTRPTACCHGRCGPPGSYEPAMNRPSPRRES